MRLAAFTTGLVFALGLGISGMTQPDKVINFLGLGPGWDPSLALVMVGAIGVHAVLYRFVLKRPSPLFGDRFGIPTRADIDGRLVVGAALFGAGWALSGVCPGPGIVASVSATAPALVFLVAMSAGMVGFHILEALLHEMKAEASEGAEEPRTVRVPVHVRQ